MRDLSRERDRRKGGGERARGVTGLGGFVKAMHCKELTTTIPSLSPSCLPPLSLSDFSLSLSHSSRRTTLSLSRSLILRLFISFSSRLFPPFSLFRLSFSLGALFPPLPLALSFSSSFYDFLSVPLTLSSPPLFSSLSAPICLSFGRSSPPAPSAPYLFLSLPPSRSRRARWGALATCASLVNNRPDSSRSSTRGISLARVIQDSFFFLFKSISLAAIFKSGNGINRYANTLLEHPAYT